MIDDKTDDKNKKSYSLSFRYRWFWIVFLILFIGWEWRWRWRWCWWDNSDGYWYRYGDSCCVWKALRRYLKSTQGKTIYILFFLLCCPWRSSSGSCRVSEDFVWNSVLLPEDPRHRWRSSWIWSTIPLSSEEEERESVQVRHRKSEHAAAASLSQHLRFDSVLTSPFAQK